MIRIATFKWGTRYTLDHVAKLRSMLARNLTISWEFVLISDDPSDEHFTAKAGIRFLPLWPHLREQPGCAVRLRAFNPDVGASIGERFAWIDMDVVVTGNVDHIFSRPEPIVLLATPKPPLPFNGSLVIMDAGARPEVLGEWSLASYRGSAHAWGAMGVPGGPSDEKWMGSILGPDALHPAPPEATVGGKPGVDGIYYFRRHLLEGGLGHGGLPADARLVLFNGRHKPWHPDVKALSPWVLEHYR